MYFLNSFLLRSFDTIYFMTFFWCFEYEPIWIRKLTLILWKSWAPPKVIVFSWQLLLDRILTRSNLVRRGVPLPHRDLGCVSCSEPSESAVHLFIVCSVVLSVWYQVSRWLGWEFVIPIGLSQLFQAFTGLGRGKRVRLGLLLVWHAVIWTI